MKNLFLYTNFLLFEILSAATVSAQTLPSGVINAPPTVVGENESIGSNTTLTVMAGGTVGNSFDAGLSDGSSTNVEVNIDGGNVGINFDAFSGSIVRISGGNVGGGFWANPGSTVTIDGGELSRGFDAFSGSTVTISGGKVGWDFDVSSGSTVTFFGGEFNLNNTPFSSPTITLEAIDVFTGTFADGSPFLFSPSSSDNLQAVRLAPSSLPPINTIPMVVNGSTPSSPHGLRVGQTLTLQDGGTLPDYFSVVRATLNIEGGEVESNLEAADSIVNISGGSVGDFFSAFSGSTVNISGGSVDSDFDAFAGSIVNVYGGSVDSDFDAHSGSTVNISGGRVSRFFDAISGSTVNVTGTAFFLDDNPIEMEIGSTITISDTDVLLSGSLADGTEFSFDLQEPGGRRSGISPDATLTLTLVPVPEPSTVTLLFILSAGVLTIQCRASRSTSQ